MNSIKNLQILTIFLVIFTFSCKDKTNDIKPEEILSNPEFKSISASSILENKIDKYGPKNLFDKKTSSWCEGKKDDGISESITINLVQKSEINKIYIKNGFGDKKFFKANNRVKKISINAIGLELKDSSNLIEYKLPKTIKADKLEIKILSVYSGDKWKDTCINEISFKKILEQAPIEDANFPIKYNSQNNDTGCNFILQKSGDLKGTTKCWASGCSANFIKGNWFYINNKSEIKIEYKYKYIGGEGSPLSSQDCGNSYANTFDIVKTKLLK